MNSYELEKYKNILKNNVGFNDIELWLRYAALNNFKQVNAKIVRKCPDCGADSKRTLGQYVYYSTLIHLLECAKCSLIWSDAHIDPDIIDHHFEMAYKEEEYFHDQRSNIFKHIATVIDRNTRNGASVIDIGGAKGDMMSEVARLRPDLRITILDISNIATRWAGSHFGFETITGDIHILENSSNKYDVVVMSDVLYYEPQISKLWKILPYLIRENGFIVIRVPNKLLIIRLFQLIRNMIYSRNLNNLQYNIKFYNPEHIYLFRRRYLESRLITLGFDSVKTIPSELLASSVPSIIRILYFKFASIINIFSWYKIVLTPSMLVIGTFRGSRTETV